MKSRPPPKPEPTATFNWELRLYVAGPTPKSVDAFRNLRRLCEECVEGQYRIEVIDLKKNPELAQRDQIVAVPALLRVLPLPTLRIIGDLSNKERVRESLGLPLRAAAFLQSEQDPADLPSALKKRNKS